MKQTVGPFFTNEPTSQAFLFGRGAGLFRTTPPPIRVLDSLLATRALRVAFHSFFLPFLVRVVLVRTFVVYGSCGGSSPTRYLLVKLPKGDHCSRSFARESAGRRRDRRLVTCRTACDAVEGVLRDGLQDGWAGPFC